MKEAKCYCDRITREVYCVGLTANERGSDNDNSIV